MASMPITSLCTCTFNPQFDRATKHPFLKAAGEGRVSKAKLSQWLSQDRLYAQSYVRFIGLLLSKVQLPSHNPSIGKSSSDPTVSISMEERIFEILVESLVNIQRELRFFEETALEYGLDLSAPPNEFDESYSIEKQRSNRDPNAALNPTPITRAYIDLFMSAGSPATSLLEGMVVLFATEHCYLHAWKYAASCQSVETASPDCAADADGGALRLKFIPNWTSHEFDQFVARLRSITDDLSGQLRGAQELERERGKCLAWWRQVLWLEERFWPRVHNSDNEISVFLT